MPTAPTLQQQVASNPRLSILCSLAGTVIARHREDYAHAVLYYQFGSDWILHSQEIWIEDDNDKEYRVYLMDQPDDTCALKIYHADSDIKLELSDRMLLTVRVTNNRCQHCDRTSSNTRCVSHSKTWDLHDGASDVAAIRAYVDEYYAAPVANEWTTLLSSASTYSVPSPVG